MSVGFQAVMWNKQKIIYDIILVVTVLAYLTAFNLIEGALHPPKTIAEHIDLEIRAYGTCAFLMLTVILSIGPLARLSPRFLPLLYNRRHFGVFFFLIAFSHALLMLQWFAAQEALPSLRDELTDWPKYFQFIGFPYKPLGMMALLIFALMAATSHDYWLAFLGPPFWKALHMLVYAAYGLVVLHVALGAMQQSRGPAIPVMVGVSVLWLSLIHIVAGVRERKLDLGTPVNNDWLTVGPPDSIPDKKAKIVAAPGGERIAVFRDGKQIGALTNVCAHQNGPIGEGCIIAGFVTCPWHGYQYQLKDGCAPAPFTEKLSTYKIRLNNGIVEVDPRPLPPGTPAAIMIP